MALADSLNQEGAVLQLRGDEEGARLHYLAALIHRPNHVPSMMNLSTILSNRNQLAAATALMTKVVGMTPNNPAAVSNLGNLLTRQERYGEAESVLRQAADLAPDRIDTWHNLVLLAHRIGRQDLALSYMQKIIDLGGESPQVLNDRAHLHLARGDLGPALIDYEARWATLQHLETWDFYIPEWKGETLDGKHILLHHEQGFGDTIMTARFVRQLVEQGHRVTFGLPPALCRLFASQDWTSAYDVISIPEMTEDVARRFDFHSPLYSAMRWLKIKREDISPEPYIDAPAFVAPPIFRGDGIVNVGICWSSGRRGNQMDWRRRVSLLRSWLRLAEVPNVFLWSLGYEQEQREEVTSLGAEAIVNDRTRSFIDFADTAAFIDQLDLVIAVDTAVAHLAAAMGKPTWMLSQYTPCWRWWERTYGNGLPWYRTMRILSQQAPGDWDRQLETCASWLKKGELL